MSAESVRVRALAARPVARCTAGEIVSLASTSAGVNPEFSIARGSSGGLVAFVSRATSGARTLNVLALSATGSPSGQARVIEGATDPSAPALVATPTGYALAFRDRSAASDVSAVGRERIVLLALGADGALSRWPGARTTIAAGQPLAGGVSIESTANSQGFGAPALSALGARVALSVARGRSSGAATSVITVDDALGAFTERAALVSDGPESVRWDRAPALTVTSEGPRWSIEGETHGAPAILSLHGVTGASPEWIAEDVASPSALATESGVLLGYVSTSAEGSTVRVRAIGGASDGPLAPSTVGVYAPSSETGVALVSLGRDLAGAVTLSHLADDATGSVNVSLVDGRGAFVGRHAALASIRLRSARVATAAGDGGSVWTLLDGRADDGAPVLGLVPLRCEADREVSAQGLPSATMMQEPTPPDEPGATIERPGAIAQCAPQGAPVVLSTHSPEGEDATAGAAWKSVALSDGRVVLFAQRRVSAQRSEFVAAAVGADGVVAQRDAIVTTDSAGLLDAAPVGAEAMALTDAGALLRSRGRGDLTRAQTSVSRAWSARFVRGARGASGVVVMTRVGATNAQLAYVSLAGGRAGAAVPLSSVLTGRGGEHVVLDAIMVGSTVHALVARRAGGGLVRALVTFDPSARALAARNSAVDPFVDPLSIGGAGGSLVASGANVSMLWWDRGTVRVGRVRAGTLHDLRTVFGYLPGGGVGLSSRHGPSDQLALTAQPGTPRDDAEAQPLRYALTVHGPDGALRSLSLRAPSDPSAIPSMAEGHALEGNAVAIVYARAQASGQLQWLAQRASCAQSSTASSREGAAR